MPAAASSPAHSHAALALACSQPVSPLGLHQVPRAGARARAPPLLRCAHAAASVFASAHLPKRDCAPLLSSAERVQAPQLQHEGQGVDACSSPSGLPWPQARGTQHPAASVASTAAATPALARFVCPVTTGGGLCCRVCVGRGGWGGWPAEGKSSGHGRRVPSGLQLVPPLITRGAPAANKTTRVKRGDMNCDDSGACCGLLVAPHPPQIRPAWNFHNSSWNRSCRRSAARVRRAAGTALHTPLSPPEKRCTRTGRARVAGAAPCSHCATVTSVRAVAVQGGPCQSLVASTGLQPEAFRGQPMCCSAPCGCSKARPQCTDSLCAPMTEGSVQAQLCACKLCAAAHWRWPLPWRCGPLLCSVLRKARADARALCNGATVNQASLAVCCAGLRYQCSHCLNIEHGFGSIARPVCGLETNCGVCSANMG